MGLDSVQIGFVPPAAHVTENNVLQLVAYAHSKGFDFIVSPINSPAYRRVLFENEGCSSPAMLEWRAGMEAFKPEDLVLRTAGRRWCVCDLQGELLPARFVLSKSGCNCL
jgi:hypothetical protein